VAIQIRRALPPCFGVEKCFTKAVQWWRLAAAQGEPNAQFNLAMSYANGKAKVWLRA